MIGFGQLQIHPDFAHRVSHVACLSLRNRDMGYWVTVGTSITARFEGQRALLVTG